MHIISSGVSVNPFASLSACVSARACVHKYVRKHPDTDTRGGKKIAVTEAKATL